MSMPWFKMFHEARTDPKLRSLTAPQFRTWFDLMCYASEQPERGVIEVINDRVLAIAVAEGDVDLLNSTLDALVELKIVSCVSSDVSCVSSGVSPRFITILNFAKRQGQSVSGNAKVSTDRVRKHRQSKKLHRNETSETHETLDETRLKRSETTDRDREGDKEGDSKTPPNPQRGNGVCVSINGSEPVPIEDAPKQARPQADPAELKRIQDKAESLFPCRDFGYQVTVASHDWPLGWIDRALSDLAASGKKEWHYLTGILKRYHKQGGPDSSTSGPSLPSASEPVETPEQKAARFAKLASGMKAHLEQMKQEGRRAPRQ